MGKLEDILNFRGNDLMSAKSAKPNKRKPINRAPTGVIRMPKSTYLQISKLAADLGQAKAVYLTRLFTQGGSVPPIMDQ
jgi:hypothetical protein